MKDANKKYKKIKINYFNLLFGILNIICIFEYQNETIMKNYKVKQGVILENGVKVGFIIGNRMNDAERSKGYKNTFAVKWKTGEIQDLSMFGYHKDVVDYLKSL